MKKHPDSAQQNTPSTAASALDVEVPHNSASNLPQLQAELAQLLRCIAEAQNAGSYAPGKPKESLVVHTSTRVRRVARRGLDGKQAWREYRKEHSTCNPSDGWNILAEQPDVLLIATWHFDADDHYDPETLITYAVVDRFRACR